MSLFWGVALGLYAMLLLLSWLATFGERRRLPPRDERGRFVSRKAQRRARAKRLAERTTSRKGKAELRAYRAECERVVTERATREAERYIIGQRDWYAEQGMARSWWLAAYLAGEFEIEHEIEEIA